MSGHDTKLPAGLVEDVNYRKVFAKAADKRNHKKQKKHKTNNTDKKSVRHFAIQDTLSAALRTSTRSSRPAIPRVPMAMCGHCPQLLGRM